MKRPRRKNILIVAPDAPFPLDRAGRIRLWSLCRALRKRYSFRLIAFAAPRLAARSLTGTAIRLRLGSVFDEIELVPWEGAAEDLWFRTWEPRIRDGASFQRLGAVLQAALRSNPPDLVHVEHVQMAACRRYVWGPPAILTEHDLGWIHFRNSLRRRQNGSPDDGQVFSPADGPLWSRMLEWVRVSWEYRRVCSSFQGIVTIGAADDAWWRLWGPLGVPVENVPTGVDVRGIPFRAEGGGGRPEILFMGYYPHPPNADGAARFLRNIWPTVRAAVPRARVTFVGADPPPWLQAAGTGRVRVTGFVPDVSPWLRSARVFVAPLRLGAGLKGKVTEAFAAGVPVVAFPEAMRGFPQEARALVRLADDDASFANETVNLLSNKRLGSELSLKARRWVENNLSWEMCANRLDRFYQAVLRNGREPLGRGFVSPGD